MRRGRCPRGAHSQAPHQQPAVHSRSSPTGASLTLHIRHQTLQPHLILQATKLLSLRKKRHESEERLDTPISEEIHGRVLVCSARSEFTGMCLTHH